MAISEKKLGQSSTRVSEALSEAESIVSAAEARAAELLENAKRVSEQAREKGYRQGFEEAKQEASNLAVRLIEDSTQVSEALSREAAQLALAICANILGKHVSVDSETVQEIARQALQEAVIGDTVTIRVHPEDAEGIKKIEQDLKRIAGGAALSIVSDKSLTRGGCTVVTDFGEIDASVEALVSAVAQRLGIPYHGQRG